MTLNTRELIAALPDELEVPEVTVRQQLTELLAQLDRKPVPVSRWSRLWVVGSLQAKIALAYLAYWIRSGYASDDDRTRLLNETHLKAAVKVVASMSYMRGIMVKVGQYAAAYPHMLPDQFMEALGTLSFEAPPMHYALIRECLFEQLGTDPESIFAEFETKAFAAASLGQVHRATLKTGERVAIKIQYPNIAKTIQADYKNIMAILSPMRLSKDWDNIRAQWEDIRQMMQYETDYLREASFLERGRAVFTPEDRIVVPRVHRQFTTDRVLTMDYIDGVHIDDYLAQQPSQEARDEAGRLIATASLRIAHAARFWYGDSNHGNFLFLPDGRIGVVDFGCSREFTDEEWAYYDTVGRWHLGNHSDTAGLVRQMAGLDPDRELDPSYLAYMTELAEWWGEYMRSDVVFDFGDEEGVARGLALLRQIPEKRYFRSLPVNTWIVRHLLGFRGLLFRLKAHVRMRPLMLAESPGLFGD